MSSQSKPDNSFFQQHIDQHPQEDVVKFSHNGPGHSFVYRGPYSETGNGSRQYEVEVGRDEYAANYIGGDLPGQKLYAIQPNDKDPETYIVIVRDGKVFNAMKAMNRTWT